MQIKIFTTNKQATQSVIKSYFNLRRAPSLKQEFDGSYSGFVQVSSPCKETLQALLFQAGVTEIHNY
jgi:hypothetical protein